MKTKIKVLDCYVLSVLLYGCESWTINKTMVKRLEAAEMWFYRRMLRVSWVERKRNEEILEMANRKRSLITKIIKRQMEFLGHIIRHPGLEVLALTGKMNGKRTRGRQRITYLKGIRTWTDEAEKGGAALIELARDRSAWRNMTSDVCFRYGTT